MDKLDIILNKVQMRRIGLHSARVEILSLMGEKEVGGSGALPSDGDLHGVRECNASDEAESTEAPVNGSLEKRTDTENICDHPLYQILGCPFNNRECLDCEYFPKANVEGS